MQCQVLLLTVHVFCVMDNVYMMSMSKNSQFPSISEEKKIMIFGDRLQNICYFYQSVIFKKKIAIFVSRLQEITFFMNQSLKKKKKIW